MISLAKILMIAALMNCAVLSFADSLIDKSTGHIVDFGTAKIQNGIIHWDSCLANSVEPLSISSYFVAVGPECKYVVRDSRADLISLRSSSPFSEELPATGSLLPLAGLVGLLLLAFGLIMHMIQKAQKSNS
jgi:hypothetical protein